MNPRPIADPACWMCGECLWSHKTFARAATCCTHGRSTDQVTDDGGKKNDQEKEPLWLLPTEALSVVARVLEHGATKYDAHNWRKGMKWSRMLSAALRHLFAVCRGEWLDPETKLPHVAHAICGLCFLLAYSETKTGTDDLYKI